MLEKVETINPEQHFQMLQQSIGGLDLGGNNSLLNLLKKAKSIKDYGNNYFGYKLPDDFPGFIGKGDLITLDWEQPSENNKGRVAMTFTDGRSQKTKISFTWQGCNSQKETTETRVSFQDIDANGNGDAVDLVINFAKQDVIYGHNHGPYLEEMAKENTKSIKDLHSVTLGLERKKGLLVDKFEILNNLLTFQFKDFTPLTNSAPKVVYMPARIKMSPRQK